MVRPIPNVPLQLVVKEIAGTPANSGAPGRPVRPGWPANACEMRKLGAFGSHATLMKNLPPPAYTVDEGSNEIDPGCASAAGANRSVVTPIRTSAGTNMKLRMAVLPFRDQPPTTP